MPMQIGETVSVTGSQVIVTDWQNMALWSELREAKFDGLNIVGKVIRLSAENAVICVERIEKGSHKYFTRPIYLHVERA